MNKQKVIVYVDEFNFYYGLKGNPKWKCYYWLDIVKFFEKFMKPDQELIKVKYFSARPDNQEKNARHGRPIQLSKYESRFRQSLLPDVVHLKEKNYDLSIPEKWKLKTSPSDLALCPK